MPAPAVPANYDLNVFINCPFDQKYLELFRAVIFAVHDCGFIARCAQEINDASQVRINKIFDIISECRIGIHDISRTEVDSTSKLPRFNMPLELGMFLGAKQYGDAVQQRKICLILERKRYDYQKYCSDIAGQDIAAHGGKENLVIAAVRNLLAGTLRSKIIPAQAHRRRGWVHRVHHLGLRVVASSSQAIAWRGSRVARQTASMATGARWPSCHNGKSCSAISRYTLLSCVRARA